MLNIISTTGIVSIYKKEVMDNKVRIDGTINTYIIYMADDEKASIRSLNTTLDFTEIIDMENAKEGMEVKVNIGIKNFDTKIINGRKLNIKANLDIAVSTYNNESIDFITSVKQNDNIQFLNSTQTITSLIGKGNSKVSAKDKIAIDATDELAEIMKVELKIIDEETKISYNKVLSKADVDIEIMYLTEDNRINTVTTKIPVMGFVDIQNVNENCICDIENILRNLVVKPNSNEEHSIAIDAEIEVICSAYEMKQINIIDDMYGTDEEISFTQKEINAVTETNKIKDICTVNENIRIPELTGRVLNIRAIPQIEDMQIRNGKIIYDGNINLAILLETNNGISMKNVELPFNFNAESNNVQDNSLVETIIKIKQNDCVVKDLNIEVTIGLEFNITEQKNKKINIIQEIRTEEITNPNTYSMTIYFVKPGDTLWKIAKMFKSTMEDIAEINNIEDVNKINVGQQLYIPKMKKCRSIV